MGFFTRKKKILIIDDEPATRGMICMLLEDKGYEVLEAGTGDQGVQEAVDRLPDLIILDINLPNMSGFECLKYLRNHDKTKDIPIIMCTAHDTLDDVERCLDGGAQDYIQKPFDLNGVLSKIQRVLEKKS